MTKLIDQSSISISNAAQLLLCIAVATFTLPVFPQSEDEVSQVQDANDVELEQELIVEKQPNRFDRQLNADLDVYQQRVLDALHEEDAFSLKLSELYYEYGVLLMKAQRYDEAKEVYSEALHIQKVNHGIYSAEQLYFVKALFEAAAALDDDELVESYLNKAVTIENKNQGLVSEHLGGIFLRAGHYFIDKYYQKERRYRVKLSFLRQARFYFENVLARHNNEAIAEAALPYGELLLVSHLENSLIHEMPIIIKGDNERFNVNSLSASPMDTIELERDYQYVKGAYRRSFSLFNSYIRKARESGDSEDIMTALLSWADTLTLFNRHDEASKFYKMAWEESQDVSSQAILEQPKLIPDYDYLIDRNDDRLEETQVSVPLTFSVTKDGSVVDIKVLEFSEEQKNYITKARNQASNLNFRPAIINGDTTEVEEFLYDVKVVVN